jgi:hypothetical protein
MLWINLFQDKDRHRALLNTLKKFIVSIKGSEYLDWLIECYILKKDSAPWN